MSEFMISVPYTDFVEGICAKRDLNNIRAMIEKGNGYCSETVMAVLGIQNEKDNPFGEGDKE